MASVSPASVYENDRNVVSACSDSGKSVALKCEIGIVVGRKIGLKRRLIIITIIVYSSGNVLISSFDISNTN
jgi:hypothetical protein